VLGFAVSHQVLAADHGSCALDFDGHLPDLRPNLNTAKARTWHVTRTVAILYTSQSPWAIPKHQQALDSKAWDCPGMSIRFTPIELVNAPSPWHDACNRDSSKDPFGCVAQE
jgi:hypothetical protein